MSIATQISALQTDKTDIANAIIAKDGTVNSGDGFDNFAADILTIIGIQEINYTGEDYYLFSGAGTTTTREIHLNDMVVGETRWAWVSGYVYYSEHPCLLYSPLGVGTYRVNVVYPASAKITLTVSQDTLLNISYYPSSTVYILIDRLT